MTWPVPILVLKSPRPTEESNLRFCVKKFAQERLVGKRNGVDVLLALVIRLVLVVQSALDHVVSSVGDSCLPVVITAGLYRILHRDGVAFLRLGGAVTLRDELLGDSHCAWMLWLLRLVLCGLLWSGFSEY